MNNKLADSSLGQIRTYHQSYVYDLGCYIPAAGETRTSVSVYFYILAQSLRVRLVYIRVGVFCTGLACDIIRAVATGLESKI